VLPGPGVRGGLVAVGLRGGGCFFAPVGAVACPGRGGGGGGGGGGRSAGLGAVGSHT